MFLYCLLQRREQIRGETWTEEDYSRLLCLCWEKRTIIITCYCHSIKTCKAHLRVIFGVTERCFTSRSTTLCKLVILTELNLFKWQNLLPNSFCKIWTQHFLSLLYKETEWTAQLSLNAVNHCHFVLHLKPEQLLPAVDSIWHVFSHCRDNSPQSALVWPVTIFMLWESVHFVLCGEMCEFAVEKKGSALWSLFPSHPVLCFTAEVFRGWRKKLWKPLNSYYLMSH